MNLNLDAAREQIRLAKLTPGEAVSNDCYEEHLLARAGALSLASTLLDATLEHRATRRFAESRARDWYELATKLREENERLWLRVRAAEGRHKQSERLREMYLRERRKHKAEGTT